MFPPDKPGAGKRKQKPPLVTYGKKQRRSLPFRLLDELPTDVYSSMFSPSTDQTDYSQKPPVPPRPAPGPRSQKEAMMAVEASDSNIASMLELGMCDRDTARRYLRVKQNNLEQAMDAMLNGESLSKLESETRWDDSEMPFGSEKNDGTGKLMTGLGAPTAPNSRAPSPNGGIRKDLAPSTVAQSDEDYAMALAESMKGLPAQQETGTVRKDAGSGSGSAVFGPANRSDYNPRDWAMVPAQSSSEVVPDVLDVRDRVNKAGEPRFVKPLASVDGDYLPSLLTICHAITGAREALLVRGDVRANYGEDPEWWKGHQITLPRIVHTDSGRPVDEEDADFDALVAEVQRLMAFLDQSERSYASATALVQNSCLKSNGISNPKSKTLLELFMNQWDQGTAHNNGAVDASAIFQTTFAKNNSDGMVRDTENASLVDLDTAATNEDKADLIGLLDAQVWGDGIYDNPPFSIESPAEVIVVRLRQTDDKQDHLNVDVPAEFNIDKYLTKNEQTFQPVRSKMAAGRQRIKKLGEAETKLTKWQHPKKNQLMNARDLLKHSYDVLSGNKKLEADDSGLPNGVAHDEQPPHYKDIAAKLEKVMSSIDDKLEKLAAEKEKTRKAIAEMSRNPLPEGDFTPEARYTLCGLSTKPNITYVLLPKAEDDVEEMDIEEDDGTPDGMQWWRIEYQVNATGTGANVSKSKMPGYDVLRAVELEHKSALLVYASAHMTHLEDINTTLPNSLQAFVDRDNELFRAEIEQSKNGSNPPSYFADASYHIEDIPRESIERKGSNDSLAVQRDGEDLQLDGTLPTPPAYEDEGDFERHNSFGLPPTKQGYYQPPPPEDDVAEIHLEGPEPVEEDEPMGMEMVKNPQPLIPGLGGGSDVRMADAESQDAGERGAVREMEDAEMR